MNYLKKNNLNVLNYFFLNINLRLLRFNKLRKFVFFRKTISTNNKRFILEIKDFISKINRLLLVEINEKLYFFNVFLKKYKEERLRLKILNCFKIFNLKMFMILEILKQNPANLNRLVLFKFFKNEFCKLKKNIFFFKKIIIFLFFVKKKKKMKKVRRRKFIKEFRIVNISKYFGSINFCLNIKNKIKKSIFLSILQNYFLFFYFFKLMSEQCEFNLEFSFDFGKLAIMGYLLKVLKKSKIKFLIRKSLKKQLKFKVIDKIEQLLTKKLIQGDL